MMHESCAISIACFVHRCDACIPLHGGCPPCFCSRTKTYVEKKKKMPVFRQNFSCSCRKDNLYSTAKGAIRENHATTAAQPFCRQGAHCHQNKTRFQSAPHSDKVHSHIQRKTERGREKPRPIRQLAMRPRFGELFCGKSLGYGKMSLLRIKKHIFSHVTLHIGPPLESLPECIFGNLLV
jgi:hypothetical protein